MEKALLLIVAPCGLMSHQLCGETPAEARTEGAKSLLPLTVMAVTMTLRTAL